MQQPHWLNKQEYPFNSNFRNIGGYQMHYVDEGSGPILLMVHGTPSWSFQERYLIKELSKEYRCIAIDHIGFGLSEKPLNADLRPETHAVRLKEFIHALGLKDITLMVHDFGGPIGLAYALDEPDNVKKLVIANTWMWSLKGLKHFETPEKLLNNWFGKFLYLNMNFSVNVMLPTSFADRKKLTPALHAQYKNCFPAKNDRFGTLACMQSLLGSSDFYESLWEKRDRIRSKPTLIFWGMKDRLIPAEFLLGRWEDLFGEEAVIRLPKAGHFIQEEAHQEMLPLMREFLG